MFGLPLEAIISLMIVLFQLLIEIFRYLSG
jgi:hypothetical protein